MFEKQGGKWVNKVDQRNLASMGSYGVAGERKPVQWGSHAYGLLVNDGWGGYGQFTSFQNLHGFENGSFRHIFNIQLSDTNGASLNPEKYGWDAEWKFGPPAPNGIFDMVVRLKPGNSYPKEPGNRKGVPVQGVYRYDGTVYKHLVKHVSLGPE